MAAQVEEMTNLRAEELAAFINLWRSCTQARIHMVQNHRRNNARIELLTNLEIVSSEVVRIGLRPFSVEEIMELLELTEILRRTIAVHPEIIA